MKAAEFPNDLTQAAFRESELLVRVERLTAENERLRDALRRINEIELQEYGPDYAEIETAQIIASAALDTLDQ